MIFNQLFLLGVKRIIMSPVATNHSENAYTLRRESRFLASNVLSRPPFHPPITVDHFPHLVSRESLTFILKTSRFLK